MSRPRLKTAVDFSRSKKDCKTALNALSSAINALDAIPHADTRELMLVLDKAFCNKWTAVHNRIVEILSSVLEKYVAASRDKDPLFEVAANDAIEDALELVHTSIDAAEGLRDLPPLLREPMKDRKAFTSHFCVALDIPKPQLHFEDYPPDNSDAPFVPPYSNFAPNGNAGADEDGTDSAEQHLVHLFKKNAKRTRKVNGPHPYDNEIESAAKMMASIVHDSEDIRVFKPLQETPFKFINTERQLFALSEHLKRSTVIAVDVENHSVRSFMGFSCLVQISTREEDYVIDTIALRSRIHRALASVFADANIVKVMHGADNDIEWLERDFGIYVVNLFDTGQAARVLKYPLFSLSYLLAKFCEISATNKKIMQRSDWRERPVPKPMLEYARADTHYLLYIYDELRSELSKKEKLAESWSKSAEIARRRFKKHHYNASLAPHLAAKYGLGLDAHQMRVLQELCKWRDMTAREEDESIHYMLPNGAMFALARARDNARTAAGVVNAIPANLQAPILKEHSGKLANLISDALDAKVVEEDKNKTVTPFAKKRARSTSPTGEIAKSCQKGDTSIEPDSKTITTFPIGAKSTVTPKPSPAEGHATPQRGLVRPLSGRNVKVTMKGNSMLFGDSCSSDEDDSEVEIMKDITEKLKAKSVEKEMQNIETHNGGMHEAKETASSVVDKDGLAFVSADSAHGTAPATKKCVFDLSDSDEDDGDGKTKVLSDSAEKTAVIAVDKSDSDEEPSETVSKVMQSIKEDTRNSLIPFSNFDAKDSEEPEIEEEKDQDQDMNEDFEEAEYVPLIEREGGSKRARKRRKKDKKESKITAHSFESVEPFDYAAAKTAVSNAKGEDERKPFDTFAALRPDIQSNRKKVKRTRKRPASGMRSMSFIPSTR